MQTYILALEKVFFIFPTAIAMICKKYVLFV